MGAVAAAPSRSTWTSRFFSLDRVLHRLFALEVFLVSGTQVNSAVWSRPSSFSRRTKIHQRFVEQNFETCLVASVSAVNELLHEFRSLPREGGARAVRMNIWTLLQEALHTAAGDGFHRKIAAFSDCVHFGRRALQWELD